MNFLGSASSYYHSLSHSTQLNSSNSLTYPSTDTNTSRTHGGDNKQQTLTTILEFFPTETQRRLLLLHHSMPCHPFTERRKKRKRERRLQLDDDDDRPPSQHDALALGLPTFLLGQQSSTGGVFKDLAHALVGLGRAFEVLVGINLLANFLSLESNHTSCQHHEDAK